ncbi:MAG: hypothetical protein A2539_10065 [Elusimicrobia bacterium RIFOXYD2_FULL_34_15]|nr:MAG: hypothetical protein A2539_10065 [Elusimicrobia bacterium RIFOXYD2_FULL_34_15]
MNFEKFLKEVKVELGQIAFKFSRYNNYMDEDDLLSEMVLHLWKRWYERGFNNKTKSYVIQSCYFYLRNYLRINEDKKCRFINIDECIGDDGLSYEEIIPDNSVPILESIEENTIFQKISNNGLSSIEREIFKLLYDEYTVREIGEMLSISHTMVIKHKKNILKKVSKYYDYLLV